MSTVIDKPKQGYLGVIEVMGDLDPPMFVFGGIAEDALLDHELTRPHSDIDVMVLRDELGQRLRQCRALGFDDFRVYYEPIQGQPLVLGGRKDSLNLELGILDRDEHGHYFTVTHRAHHLCKIYLPDDLFAYPSTLLLGTPIRTLSPLALYQIRAGLDTTKTFGGLRAKDIAAQRRLRTAFLADQSEEALRPRIESSG